ncbi:hypothetical protein JW930_00430 [Candidatus Woesearchaeota archaeon]|nr:hypothetical protein [Candidatus Woesearchaeota archaeon]
MTELVACLLTGKGTWAHVANLIKNEEWKKVFLITNDFGKEKFQKSEKIEFVVINIYDEIEKIIADIKSQLKDKITGTEVALNFISGTGKEHMAILSALLGLGLGIRLVVSDENEVKLV